MLNKYKVKYTLKFTFSLQVQDNKFTFWPGLEPRPESKRIAAGEGSRMCKGKIWPTIIPAIGDFNFQ